MDELWGQIATTVRGMWIYRRLAMALAWLVAVAGVVVVLMMPDHYQASARVYVDTQSILRPLMMGIAVQPNIEQQVGMLSRTLLSRPTIERLIRTADLDLGAQTKVQSEAMVDKVTKTISIKTTGRDNLYTLSYADQNPEVARRVVQTLLTIFVESSLGATRQDSDSARRFLDEQIKSYEAKLTQAEGRLKEFKLRNIELQSQNGLDSAGRAAEVGNLLSQARLELREAESARMAASRQLQALRSSLRQPASVPSPALVQTPEIDARLDVQRRNLDTLLQRYTEEHPDVANSRRLIRELEGQKRHDIQELQRRAQANPNDPLVQNNPAVQELSRIYAAAEVQVASLQARVAEYEARASRVREQLKVAPRLEAELAQLNRDYEINHKNYADLVGRRESAFMSGQLENTANVAEFRVIDPPRVNPKPVAPNRVLLLPVSLVAALGAGLGMAFLMSQIRPVFFDGAGLRQWTELPLLGVVELIPNEKDIRSETRSLRRFFMALLALIFLYAGGMAMLSYQSALLG
ncbi:XrtA system polysaccharide chain length determinant [Simplicispira psychrophila]|uniref:XrtA system polysaccharide chain length determinant n=1 Tax=Simplicispira psychrophila TaxID=80882 RepID=UPI0004837C89|nr:XrtA system polysaccharide chain length determinant [Simplicispira psychrophila]